MDGEECDEAELVGYGGNGKVDVKVECGVGSRHGMLVCFLEDGRSEMVLDVSVRSLRYLFESASFSCSRRPESRRGRADGDGASRAIE